MDNPVPSGHEFIDANQHENPRLFTAFESIPSMRDQPMHTYFTASPRYKWAGHLLPEGLIDHPEFHKFIKNIAANPDHPGPKLVLADWLEEQGHTDFAQHLREHFMNAPEPKKFQEFAKPIGYAAPEGPAPKPKFIDPHGNLSHEPHLHFTGGNSDPWIGTAHVLHADKTHTSVIPTNDGFHVLEIKWPLEDTSFFRPGQYLSPLERADIEIALNNSHKNLQPHLRQLRDHWLGSLGKHQGENEFKKSAAPMLGVFTDKLEEMGHPHAEALRQEVYPHLFGSDKPDAMQEVVELITYAFDEQIQYAESSPLHPHLAEHQGFMTPEGQPGSPVPHVEYDPNGKMYVQLGDESRMQIHPDLGHVKTWIPTGHPWHLGESLWDVRGPEFVFPKSETRKVVGQAIRTSEMLPHMRQLSDLYSKLITHAKSGNKDATDIARQNLNNARAVAADRLEEMGHPDAEEFRQTIEES